MSYSPPDTGEFVRGCGKGDRERNHGYRDKYNTVNWRSSEATGFKRLSPGKQRKVYK